MTLRDIRLIDHPKGREAMLGWMVRTPQGFGTIARFVVRTEKEGSPHWLVAVEFFHPDEMLNSPHGYRPEEIEILGTGVIPDVASPPS